MRVITGLARGRKLKTLDGESVRPTTDCVKEAMFSIVHFELEGRRILDLFAGSGQLGIEALSRGAKSCVFVDSARASLGVTEENLEATGFRTLSKTVLSDSVAYLLRTDEVYDIAFLDPPYHEGIMLPSLEALLPHMAAGGTIVCETASTEVLPDTIGDFFAKRYRYGKIALTVYRKEG